MPIRFPTVAGGVARGIESGTSLGQARAEPFVQAMMERKRVDAEAKTAKVQEAKESHGKMYRAAQQGLQLYLNKDLDNETRLKGFNMWGGYMNEYVLEGDDSVPDMKQLPNNLEPYGKRALAISKMVNEGKLSPEQGISSVKNLYVEARGEHGDFFESEFKSLEQKKKVANITRSRFGKEPHELNDIEKRELASVISGKETKLIGKEKLHTIQNPETGEWGNYTVDEQGSIKFISPATEDQVQKATGKKGVGDLKLATEYRNTLQGAVRFAFKNIKLNKPDALAIMIKAISNKDKDPTQLESDFATVEEEMTPEQQKRFRAVLNDYMRDFASPPAYQMFQEVSQRGARILEEAGVDPTGSFVDVDESFREGGETFGGTNVEAGIVTIINDLKTKKTSSEDIKKMLEEKGYDPELYAEHI